MSRVLCWIPVLALGCGRIGFEELVSVDRARVTLSVGNGFACTIRDAQVWCWGEAGAGQLGAADLGFATLPLQVPVPDATSVSAGGAHACAVTTSGDVYCWGSNDALQIGTTPSAKLRLPGSPMPEPTRVATLPLPAIAVGTGAAHTCALLSDRTVWCWGSNQTGQLGHGTVQDINELPEVVAGVTDVAELAIARESSCVLGSTGTVTCWGENSAGQLGDGTDLTRGTPRTIANLTATALAVGGAHACALLESGQYTCWGKNNFGQHGNGTDLDTKVPDPPSVLDGFVAITAASDHTCGLRVDGLVSCWGGNLEGVLGDGTTSSRSTPIAIDAGGRVVVVAAGSSSTCAIREDNVAMCWGWGSRGGLGNGRSALPTAQRVGVGLAASAIAAGRTHVCALVANGDVACWGNNSSGQLGDDTKTLRTTPVTVQRAWTPAAVELAIGDSHTCIRSMDGEAWCWGNNDFGQLGDGTNNTRTSPVLAPTGALTKLDAGVAHTCGIRAADSKVVCWGYNAEGSLGNSTTTNSPSAVQTLDDLGADLTATDLALGEFHSCARRGTEVLCWGDNDQGQLGSGTTDRTSAIAVPGVTADVVIAGGASMCANDPNDTSPICWGANDNNLLTSLDMSPLPPTRSVHPEGFQMARVNSCDATDGCWGSNFLGQLGDGSFSDRSDPGGPIVGLPANVTSVSVGYDYACAIAGGEVYCWGDNVHGQLGIGTTTRAVLPESVVGLP